jgi:hypothetical protein
MRAERDDSLYAAAYAYRATQSLWHDFVHESRHDNTYAHSANWTCADIDEHVEANEPFTRFVSGKVRGRYNWINLSAYSRHTTFEVRLHHATLKELEVCNWIKANTRFTDWAATIGYEAVKEKLDGKTSDEQFDIIAREAWQDDDLRAYYAEKSGRTVVAA